MNRTAPPPDLPPARRARPTGPVAYLTGQYPRMSHTFIQREVAGLRALGVEVRTCQVRAASAAEIAPDQQAEAAATFTILDAARRPHRLVLAHLRLATHAPRAWWRALALGWKTRPPGLRAALYQLFYFAEAGVLADHLHRIGAAHLHNHFADSSGTVAMLAAELADVPWSFTEHGPNLFFAPERWRLDEKVARARFVACISHFCRSQVMLFSDPAHWPKLQIVRCGIEPERYGAAPDRPADAAAPRLLFIGRLAAVKGVPVLLQALARLAPAHPELELTLIGDGPDRAALEQQAAALGVAERVGFAGLQGEAEVAAALGAHDMLVLPSFAEGVPVVLMEAMASRLPVVATRVGGVAELVQDGASGLLVAPGDAVALSEAIAALLDDPVQARRMGEAGRAFVLAHHDARREAARLAELFAAATGGAAASAQECR